MIDLARVNYRSDTKQAVLSVTDNGVTEAKPIDRRQIMALLESISEALKKMEELR